jgi:hypothetical protein
VTDDRRLDVNTNVPDHHTWVEAINRFDNYRGYCSCGYRTRTSGFWTAQRHLDEHRLAVVEGHAGTTSP